MLLWEATNYWNIAMIPGLSFCEEGWWQVQWYASPYKNDFERKHSTPSIQNVIQDAETANIKWSWNKGAREIISMLLQFTNPCKYVRDGTSFQFVSNFCMKLFHVSGLFGTSDLTKKSFFFLWEKKERGHENKITNSLIWLRLHANVKLPFYNWIKCFPCFHSLIVYLLLHARQYRGSKSH